MFNGLFVRFCFYLELIQAAESLPSVHEGDLLVLLVDGADVAGGAGIKLLHILIVILRDILK